jgi:DNA polymerase III epsilon subunit family exonuclease
MKGFAALDIETTGLSSARDRIIEVSVVLYDAKGTQERVYSSLVNPLVAIPSPASSINGITDSMVSQAPTFTQIAQDLYDVLNGRVLVGHNIGSFDNRFLEAAFAAAGMRWTPDVVLDTLHLARVAYPGLKSHKLATLCAVVGITNEQAHRAESDARATWQLLCTIAGDDIDDITGLGVYYFPVVVSSAPVQVVARKDETAKVLPLDERPPHQESTS